MDVKSLYTNVPVDEAIGLAVEALYEHNEDQVVEENTLKKLMKLAVTNVWFMSGQEWFIQTDGVAMGAAMAVILANLWLKKFEGVLAQQQPTEIQAKTPPEVSNICGKCTEMVAQGFAVRCKKCQRWFHRKCTPFTVAEVRKMKKSDWHCGCTPTDTQPDEQHENAKVFDRYVDDIIRTAKYKDIQNILIKSNSLHKNLEFTIERLENGSIPFLDMKIHVDGGNLNTAWYQKPTDTGLMLSFRSMAPKAYKRNIIEGTVHRIFNSTSTWQHFDSGLEEAMKCWENNQYPPQFYQPIVRRTIEKRLRPVETKKENPVQEKMKREAPTVVLQYRGHDSDELAKRLKKSANVTTIFTLRKMKTALPSLKSKIPKMFCSNVVYEVICPGCQSSYVGQTTRHLTTRMREHSRPPSHVAEHFALCQKQLNEDDVKIIDRSSNPAKLLTLEALHIARRRPAINKKEEYRTRQLTLKM